MEKIHLEQAKLWFEAAQHIANLQESQRYAVAIALVVHAIIKANDALTWKFSNITAKRHDDARRLFEDLIKKNVINAEYARCKQIIQDAIDVKARAEYRGGYFSKSDYDKLARKAETFLEMAGKVV